MRGMASLLSVSRITQFVSVGAVGAMVETIVVAIITTASIAGPLPAKVVGAELSITLMFVLNDRFTFASEGQSQLQAIVYRWGRSHLVRIVGLATAFVVLWILTARTEIAVIVGGADFWPTIANLIGIGIGMVLNYIAESVFTWRVLSESA